MNQKNIAHEVEVKISALFDELRSGMAEREDSRAFGAMIERRITDNWVRICNDLGYDALDRPGRRTIFDFAFRKNDRIVGIDVKTKDLDSTRYSDGGICAVGNLLKGGLKISRLQIGRCRETRFFKKQWLANLHSH